MTLNIWIFSDCFLKEEEKGVIANETWFSAGKPKVDKGSEQGEKSKKEANKEQVVKRNSNFKLYFLSFKFICTLEFFISLSIPQVKHSLALKKSQQVSTRLAIEYLYMTKFLPLVVRSFGDICKSINVLRVTQFPARLLKQQTFEWALMG